MGRPAAISTWARCCRGERRSRPWKAGLTTTTQGAYTFAGLRPGTYSITETQPAEFISHVNNVGTLGGQVGTDQFTSIVVNVGADGLAYNFGEIKRPGCNLLNMAGVVGDKVAVDLAARARNPARFDRLHPKVGAMLAAGQVPRGVGGYPRGPLVYALVPTIGTKRIVRRIDPKTGKSTLVGIPNFPAPLSPKVATVRQTAAATRIGSEARHPRTPGRK